jgi:hypothetical protein
MGLNIEIDENDEFVYEFPESDFELVLHSSGDYLLCENGYFPVNGLGSFKPFDNQYVILNEDSKFFITEEDFEKIKQIYLQK